jgi:hypothetical protein
MKIKQIVNNFLLLYIIIIHKFSMVYEINIDIAASARFRRLLLANKSRRLDWWTGRIYCKQHYLSQLIATTMEWKTNRKFLEITSTYWLNVSLAGIKILAIYTTPGKISIR